MLDISKYTLYQLYTVEKKTKKSICDLLGCCLHTLNKKLKQYNIPNNGKKIEDLSNQRFGRLITISYSGSDHYGHPVWLCKCDCGNTKVVAANSLRQGLTTSCGCYKHDKAWKGCGDISGSFWKKLETTATRRGYSFDITIEQAWDIFLKQDKTCAITGIPLSFASHYSHRYDAQNASPDRIDSNYGYLPDNFQWVHKSINKIKGVLTNAELIALCKSVYLYNKEYADKLDINVGEINAWQKKNLLQKQN